MEKFSSWASHMNTLKFLQRKEWRSDMMVFFLYLTLYCMDIAFLVKSAGKERGMSPGPPANRVWQASSYFSVIVS